MLWLTRGTAMLPQLFDGSPKSTSSFSGARCAFLGHFICKTEIPQANDPASKAAQNTSYPPVQPVPMLLPSPVSYTRGLAETIRFAVLVLCKDQGYGDKCRGLCRERLFSRQVHCSRRSHEHNRLAHARCSHRGPLHEEGFLHHSLVRLRQSSLLGIRVFHPSPLSVGKPSEPPFVRKRLEKGLWLPADPQTQGDPPLLRKKSFASLSRARTLPPRVVVATELRDV